MKEWYRQLRLEFQVVVWSLIVVLGLVITAIPCFFFSLMEIPQGIALGGGFAILIYLILGLIDNEEKAKRSMVITIIVIILKAILISGLLVLIGWLYYSVGFKAFNIFAVAGGYLIPLAVHIILILVRKE